MTRINAIQNAIRELEGGSYQKLLDEYLYKKYNLENIHALGVETATNKPTKGMPDTFVEHDNRTRTLIMYGTVKGSPFAKLKGDIVSSLELYEEDIESGKVKEIIAAYTSTNINPHQLEELRDLNTNIKMTFVGLSTLSHDLLVRYPRMASDHLSIQVDSEQIFTPDDFIKRYDNNEMNTPLSLAFQSREKEMENLYKAVNQSIFTIVTGQSGVGKTKLVIEACKQYEKDGYKVLCIKNNSTMIFEDMRYYFGNPGKYILFIDDINQTSDLEFILDFVTTPSKGISIKVVATIRDYAKKQTVATIKKYFRYNEIVIKPFEIDEVKNILKETLKINHESYLHRIAKISKGNIRLAILAGMHAKEKGYPAINNASDIFKNYYGEILESQELSQKEVYALFIVALIHSFRMNDNDFANALLKEFNINTDEFIAICHKLNEIELVDLYYDEVVKMSNQSFRDYILDYGLITKKIISISRLLNIGFPKYRDKIIFSLNTITNLFPSEEANTYIKEQVNKSWEDASPENQRDYLNSFYNLNEVKAIQIIKQMIDEMEQQEIDIADISEPINNPNIRNEFIRILGGFKYSKYYEIVIDLLGEFFKKRLDLFKEFYAVFSTSYSYDEKSIALDYKKEYQLIDKLWEISEYGGNRNSNFLIIYLSKEFLKCSIHKVEAGNTISSVQIQNFELIYSVGIRKLRSLIWQILSQLYKEDLYKKMIHSVLIEHYGGVINEGQYILIFQHDLKCIKELFVDKWKEPTFEQSIVLNTLKERAEDSDIEYDESFDLYRRNKDFIIYHALSKDYYLLEDYDKAEENKRADLLDLINEYTINDFENLFLLCQKLEKNLQKDIWIISQSISVIFSLIENWEIYVDVIRVYLKNNTPYYSRSVDSIIYKLINLIGVDPTKQLLVRYNYISKNQWLGKYWALIPEDELCYSHVESLIHFVSSQIDEDIPFIPNISNLEKYSKLDNNVVEKISNYILKMNPDSQVSAQFLMGGPRGENVETIIELFTGNVGLLEKLYLFNNYEEVDYSGKLLVKLIENNTAFWNEYTCEIAQNKKDDAHFSRKFDLIWSTNNYSKLIEIAYNNLIIDKYGYIDSGWSKTIFSMKDKNYKQKENWIKEYIEKNKNEIEKIRSIFCLIHKVLEGNKLKFFIEFVKYNKNIEDFKQLPIDSGSDSWSGSAVPMVDNKINFVQKLMDELSGIDYIHHLGYLDERLAQLKKLRKEIEIREYMSELY